jgi:hypothetical protein
VKKEGERERGRSGEACLVCKFLFYARFQVYIYICKYVGVCRRMQHQSNMTACFDPIETKERGNIILVFSCVLKNDI